MSADPEMPQYVNYFWDSIEQDMLRAYQSLMEHPSSAFVHENMEFAVRFFMTYDKSEKAWIRMRCASVDTRETVDYFCRHVMCCVSMGCGECRVRGVNLKWVQKLQTVMALAQTMFQNINKEVAVGIERWDGRRRWYETTKTHIINAKHTIQEAVTQEYAAFPGLCLRLYVQRQTTRGTPGHTGMFERAKPWPRAIPGDAAAGTSFFMEHWYSRLRNGDVVRILLDDRVPGGPAQGEPPGPENLPGPMDDPWRLTPNNPRLTLGSAFQEMDTCLHAMADP